jgi:hypothetical protein
MSMPVLSATKMLNEATVAHTFHNTDHETKKKKNEFCKLVTSWGS